MCSFFIPCVTPKIPFLFVHCSIFVGSTPHPVIVANEGLQGFSTKNVTCNNPGGDCFWVRGRSKIYIYYIYILYMYTIWNMYFPKELLQIAAEGGVDLKSAVTRRFSMEQVKRGVERNVSDVKGSSLDMVDLIPRDPITF